MLHRLLRICKPYSSCKMFFFRGILTFAELLRKSIYRFTQHIEHCLFKLYLLCYIIAFDVYFLTDPKMVEWYSLCKIKNSPV